MLCVAYPATYVSGRMYVLDVLLGEFLGLEFVAVAEERQDVQITLQGDSYCRELVIADVLFQTDPCDWLTEEMLPRLPLETWEVTQSSLQMRLVDSKLPVIYGKPLTGKQWTDGQLLTDPWLIKTESSIKIGADLLGSSFFMLTRLEEIVCTERDARERFPAKASLAYQAGFLARPIVNEYLEVLWWALQELWPGLRRKERQFQVRLSHDVDWPLSSLGRTWSQVLKTAAGDVVKRGSLALATRRLSSYMQGRNGNYDGDLYHTFDFIMDFSEQHGLQSAFYFITDHTAGDIDGVYAIGDPWIRKLMRQMHERGHEIGLHPSYATFRDPEQIKREMTNLLHVIEQEGIQQMGIGGRHHYLRWENPITWQAWQEAGLLYDSTLGYADHIGFRCGTCYEYPVYDLQNRAPCTLRERPLVVMEQMFFGAAYMNLTHEQALPEVLLLKERCRQFAGEFTLLWHNDLLVQKEDVALYQHIVGGG